MVYRIEVESYAYPELSPRGVRLGDLHPLVGPRPGGVAWHGGGHVATGPHGRGRLPPCGAVDPTALDRENWSQYLLPPLRAVETLPRVTLDAAELARVRSGQSIQRSDVPPGEETGTGTSQDALFPRSSLAGSEPVPVFSQALRGPAGRSRGLGHRRASRQSSHPAARDSGDRSTVCRRRMTNDQGPMTKEQGLKRNKAQFPRESLLLGLCRWPLCLGHWSLCLGHFRDLTAYPADPRRRSTGRPPAA